MRLPAWFRGLRLSAGPEVELRLTEADREAVVEAVQDRIADELGDWERLTSKTTLLLRLLDHADEAAAAFSLGEYQIAFEALARYHALRCEHAETIDIRLTE